MGELKTPWTQFEKDQWFKQQTVKRSYKQEVLLQIDDLRSMFDINQYGSLSLDPERYPLFLIQSKNHDKNKKTVLITGGVHGYETSGVQGALSFMKSEAQNYEKHFNFICAPCISPWGYETINRWNNKAIDPNRSFVENSVADECRLFIAAISPNLPKIFVHFDLHETTDTDNTIFRLALAARDGTKPDQSEIPDGFYTVGDSDHPCAEFQKAIIDSVRRVTHIAPPDSDGNIIGEKIEQEGVINYPVKKLHLCAGVTQAKYTTTTEVYPDSPRANDEICKQAQIAAIKGGLDFVSLRL